MIVVDTTVLVYAVGSQHTYREPSRSLMHAIGSGALRATITVEVIQEFAHVRTRRRGRADARRLATAYADILAPLDATTERHLRAGLAWWDRHEAIGAFDAVLAAVAQDFGASALVSSARAFARMTEVTHVLPDEHGVAARLS
ncbi:MAG: type II toxin-antitoxin system VapC family toxin [Nocardioidaceae bacterium]|nr:type II toxin-antitoxin system VapC family toxin [Nocardioidaceae bacterium]